MSQVVEIDYTNWEGKRRTRLIRPTGVLLFEENNYHKPAQWLLEALDLDTNKIKKFAVKDIHSWKPQPVEGM